MKKVLTTTEFVLWLETTDGYEAIRQPPYLSQNLQKTKSELILPYAELMAQPIDLGMLVPCVMDGKPTEPPSLEGCLDDCKDGKSAQDWYKECMQMYQKAKDQVLFEGELKVVDSSNGHTIRVDNKIIGYYFPNNTVSDKVIFKGEYPTIEDVARKMELKPTKAFLNKIGL